MSGGRHAGGSTISNGGDSSTSNRFIVGRRPLHPLLRAMSILPEKRDFYEYSLSIITTVLPSEKILNVLECVQRLRKMPGFIDFQARSVTEIANPPTTLSLTPFTRNFPPVDL